MNIEDMPHFANMRDGALLSPKTRVINGIATRVHTRISRGLDWMEANSTAIMIGAGAVAGPYIIASLIAAYAVYPEVILIGVN